MKGRRLYYIFSVFLLVFFWRTADFWYNASYFDDVENAGGLLYAALAGVEIVSLLMIVFSPKYRHQDHRILNLCFFWEILMLIVVFINGTPFSQYTKCLAWPLFFQASYLFIRHNTRLLKNFWKVSFVLAIMGGIYMFFALRLKDLESQTNMVYFCLLTFPMLLLTPKKRLRYFLLILSTFVAFLSMKRSMILSFALFWGIIEIKYLLSKGRKSYAIVLSAVMIIAVYGTFNVADDVTGGHLSERLNIGTDEDEDEDITNGREAIYLTTTEMIMGSSTTHQILGNGHNAVRRDSLLNISAHNEFLEIIYDYGIIMLFLYLCLWIYVLKQWFYHFRNNTPYFVPYTLSVCLFGIMAMVSQLVLYGSYFLYLVMFWGATAALRDIQESKMPKSKRL